MASIDTRITKLEQRDPSRNALAVLLCADGGEAQACEDYLANTVPARHPQYVVAIRRFTLSVESKMLYEG